MKNLIGQNFLAEITTEEGEKKEINITVIGCYITTIGGASIIVQEIETNAIHNISPKRLIEKI